MNVPAKLAGFALVLLLLFAGGLVVGRVVGPVGADAPSHTGEPATSRDDHVGGHS